MRNTKYTALYVWLSVLYEVVCLTSDALFCLFSITKATDLVKILISMYSLYVLFKYEMDSQTIHIYTKLNRSLSISISVCMHAFQPYKTFHSDFDRTIVAEIHRAVIQQKKHTNKQNCVLFGIQFFKRMKCSSI